MQVKKISYISIFVFIFLITPNSYAQQNSKDEQGRKQGLWIKYKDGVKFYEGYFKDNYPTGEFLRYYPSGRVMMKSTYSDQGKRRLTEFYYDERKRQVKAKGLYIEKKKDSLWLLYNEAGVLISEERYVNDTAHGIWALYNYLGTIVKETPYAMGYINGLQKEYFENAKLKRVISFKMDTFNGSMEVFYPDGKIRIEGFYNMGLQDKIWTYYLPSGEIMFTEKFQGGELLERVDASGKPFVFEAEQDSIPLDIDPSEVKFE